MPSAAMPRRFTSGSTLVARHYLTTARPRPWLRFLFVAAKIDLSLATESA